LVGGPSPEVYRVLEPEGGVPPRTRERGSRMLGSRAILISTASTIVFLLFLALVIYLSPGRKAVSKTFFSPEHLKGSIPQVWRGFKVNLRMMFVAEAFVLVFALLVAVVRGLPGPVFFPLRMLAVIYVDLFRGVPLILVIFMIGFGFQGLGLGWISDRSPFFYGILAIVVVYSAYVAEVYRAGIESIHPSQTAAARSLGLSNWQALRHVVLPQAIRRVIPPLLNDFIGLQKDTALVSVIGLVEVARQAQGYASKHFNFAGYVIAAILFVLLTIPLARFTDYLIDRDRRKRQAGGVR
jgi:polar amino acid transport system permease protein